MGSQFAPVSVIIPCYRCMLTIERAINSLILQSQKPREIILVDDCSDDGTLEVLHAFKSRHPEWIQVISMTSNSGPASARNAGWDAASQPYIAFLDADDAWHPRKIEIQYFWISTHPEVVLCGHKIAVNTTEAELEIRDVSLATKRIARWQWLLSCRFSIITAMLKRDLPFRFVAGKRYAEDYLLWLQISSSGYEIWKLDRVLAYCFKPLYGQGGQSGNLWDMEKGELDAYHQIYQEGRLLLIPYLGLLIFSLVKYFRRLVLSNVKRHH